MIYANAGAHAAALHSKCLRETKVIQIQTKDVQMIALKMFQLAKNGERTGKKDRERETGKGNVDVEQKLLY